MGAAAHDDEVEKLEAAYFVRSTRPGFEGRGGGFVARRASRPSRSGTGIMSKGNVPERNHRRSGVQGYTNTFCEIVLVKTQVEELACGAASSSPESI